MEDNAPLSLRHSCIWSLVVGSEAGSWARLLLHKHLEPAARLALFRTCKVFRDMLLSLAEHLTTTVALVPDDPAREFKRMRALRPALKTRGAQTTRIQFKLECVELWPLTQALSVLELEGQWLQEMEVEYQAGTLPVSIVTEIGCCYPNLKCLAIYSSLDAMPGPGLFPQLQELQICPAGTEAADLERLYRTMQPYLPPLTRLTVGRMPAVYRSSDPPPARLTHLPLLLGTSPLPGLSFLELATTLDDDLLGLLLQCAPSLQTLGVAAVHVQSDMHAQTPCAWQYLACPGKMHLSSFARLPLPEGMVVQANPFVCDFLTDQDQAALQAAVAKVTILAGNHANRGLRGLWLEPVAQLQADLQPTALHVGLELLRTCLIEGDYPPSDTWLGLNGWTMSARLVRALQGLPHWASLTLSTGIWVAVHSHMYTTLLRFLPTSFNTVFLHVDTPSIEAICWGAPMDRPFHIKLSGAASRVQSVMAALHLSETLPNVTISPF